MLPFALTKKWLSSSLQAKRGSRHSEPNRRVRLQLESLEGRLVPSVSFAGSGINPNSNITLSAAATFSQSGTDLDICLTNTTTAGALLPTDVLHGLFFDVAGSQSLTAGDARLHAGSAVL